MYNLLRVFNVESCCNIIFFVIERRGVILSKNIGFLLKNVGLSLTQLVQKSGVATEPQYTRQKKIAIGLKIMESKITFYEKN